MRYFADKILKYTKDMSYGSFKDNSLVVDASVFNLAQIGEVAHKVSRDFQKKHPDIPWRTLYGLRNQIVHEYEGVNLIIIWDIITEDLPKLRRKFDALAKES